MCRQVNVLLTTAWMRSVQTWKCVAILHTVANEIGHFKNHLSEHSKGCNSSLIESAIHAGKPEWTGWMLNSAHSNCLLAQRVCFSSARSFDYPLKPEHMNGGTCFDCLHIPFILKKDPSTALHCLINLEVFCDSSFSLSHWCLWYLITCTFLFYLQWTVGREGHAGCFWMANRAGGDFNCISCLK